MLFCCATYEVSVHSRYPSWLYTWLTLINGWNNAKLYKGEWQTVLLISSEYMYMLRVTQWLCLLLLYSILRGNVAVATMRCQSSRIAAFLQADARPMFCWPRSASTARSQVWLGLINGHFQSGGSPRSPQRQHGGGPLVVRCRQYVQRAANVCQWPGGRQDDIRWLDFHIHHMASIWYPRDLA